RGRSVDELAVRATRRKRALDNQIVAARLDTGLDQLRIQLLQILAGKNSFRSASVGAGANERFVRPFAEQKLQRADDDRFAGAGFASDRGESGRDLPLELFHEREIFDSQQIKDSRHAEVES